MQILGLLGIYFEAAVIKLSLLSKLALVILLHAIYNNYTLSGVG